MYKGSYYNRINLSLSTTGFKFSSKNAHLPGLEQQWRNELAKANFFIYNSWGEIALFTWVINMGQVDEKFTDDGF